MPTASKVVVIKNPQGLHARPIALIAQIAARFRSRLRVSAEGLEVDGKSVLQLMTLSAGQGVSLALSADGDDAESLIADIAKVVDDGFGEI